MHLVTHLGRATAQREIFDAGVLSEQIKYFAHCLHGSQTESRTVNLAADVLGNRAGADVVDLKSHSPLWTLHEVPTELMKEALPSLVQSKKYIDEKYEEKNGKRNLIDCLKSAQGYLLAIDYLIRRSCR